VLAAVVGSFLLLVAFFPLLLRVCQIAVVVSLLVVLIVLVVSVVAILFVVVVMVAVQLPIVVTGIVGIYSFWIVRVATFGI
jgi:hypothetical protein